MTYNRQGYRAGFAEAVRNHPEGLLLMIAGCALLMRSGASRRVRSSATRYRDDSEPRVDRGDRLAYRARSGLAEAVTSAGDHISDMAAKVSDQTSSYASTVADYASDAGDALSDLSAKLTRIAQERPMGIALAGFGLGAAVAAAFPSTAMERETLGVAGERLANAAGKAGEELKKATSKVGERVMAEGKDIATDVAEAFTSGLAGEQSSSERSKPKGLHSARELGGQQSSSERPKLKDPLSAEGHAGEQSGSERRSSPGTGLGASEHSGRSGPSIASKASRTGQGSPLNKDFSSS